MHTKSLAVLKRQVGTNIIYKTNVLISPAFLKNKLLKSNLYQIIRKKMVESAKEGIRQQASSLEIYGKMQEVFEKMDKGHTVSFCMPE